MPQPTPTAEAAPRDRLRRMARGMRVLIALGALGLVLVPFWALGQDPLPLIERMHGLAHDAGPITPPLPLHWIASLSSLPGVLLGLFALWQLWQLFASYGRGIVFGSEPTRRLRRLGWAMLTSALVQPVMLTLLVLVLTVGNPPGQRRLVLGLSSDSYLLLLIGSLLLAIAWAMAEGTRLQRENESFV